MRIEERLFEALQDEADRIDVDVAALHRATRDRLGGLTPTRTRRQPRRWVAPLVAAASLAAAVAGGVALLDLDGLPGGGDIATVVPDRGGVDAGFTCPAQRTIRFDGSTTDDSFLPGLDDRLRPTEDAAVAPRYEVAERDGLTVLSLGNADGTLASRTTFRRGAGGFERVEAVVCTGTSGNLVPTAGADRLGVHPGGLVDEPGQYTAKDFPHGAVLVDARASYDTAGLAHARTMWAVPCGRGVCLTAGSKTATTTTGPVRRDPLRPQDRTSQLADPDDVVGQAPPLRLFAVYDPDHELTQVSWETEAGAVTRVQPIAGGDWPGDLYLVLAPSQKFGALTVLPRDGEARSFTADQISD